MSFNPTHHFINLKGRRYLPVAARILWFRSEHPDWAIITEPVELNHEQQFSVFRASVLDAEGRVIATATKKEDAKGFLDHVEKSETGSVGRALLLCGYGTDAALDELDAGKNGEDAHIVDAPQQTRPPAARGVYPGDAPGVRGGYGR